MLKTTFMCDVCGKEFDEIKVANQRNYFQVLKYNPKKYKKPFPYHSSKIDCNYDIIGKELDLCLECYLKIVNMKGILYFKDDKYKIKDVIPKTNIIYDPDYESEIDEEK